MQLRDFHYILHKVGDANIPFEISDSNEAGDTKYYGYLAFGGAWIIMQWDTVAGTYRYKAGNELYAANWVARASLTYQYYSTLA